LTVLTLPHRRLQPLQHLLIQLRSTRHNELHLPSTGPHEHLELLTRAGQDAQPVVLGQCGQEILDGTGLIGAAGVTLKLLHDLLFIADGEGGGRQYGGKLGVFLEDRIERLDGAGSGIQVIAFGGGRVLSRF